MSAPPGGLFRRRTRPRVASMEDLWMVMLGALFGVLLGVTALYWGTGQVSGRLAGGRWPQVAFADTPQIVIRALQDPSRPAAAWPAGERALLPDAPWFYLTMLLLFLVPALLLITLLVGWFGQGSRFWTGIGWLGRGVRRSGAWARVRDLRHLIVHGRHPGRLTLGRVYGKLVAAERGQSVIVLGPARSMKTAGFAIPSILEWNGPVVATSMSADLILDTLDRRHELGTVWVYDPTASTTLPRSGWTPLAQARSWAEALRVATSLVSAAEAGRRAGEQEGWRPDVSSLLAPLLYAAANSNRVMSDVVRWVQRQERDQVLAALEEAGEPAAGDAIEGVWRLDDRQRSEIYMAAQYVLAAYGDPLVAESARFSHLTADKLLDGGAHTAYLTAPAHELERLRPLFAALLQEIVTAVYERVVATGQPLVPPLLLVLDQAAEMGALRALDVYASTAASQGIQLVSIFQDLSQIKALYGDRGETVVNNHRARVIMSGTSDQETLEYLANLLGDEEVRQVMESYGDFGDYEGFSSTQVSSYRRVTPADVLREIQPGEGLLVYGYLPPAPLKLRPWFLEPALRQLAGARGVAMEARQQPSRFAPFRRPRPPRTRPIRPMRPPTPAAGRQAPREREPTARASAGQGPGRPTTVSGGQILRPGETRRPAAGPAAPEPGPTRDAPTAEIPRVRRRR
jgi:type IV secretion system protein VirD4